MFEVLIGHCVIFGYRETCNTGTKSFIVLNHDCNTGRL